MPASAAVATRTEKDSMGTMEVPADALFGASTQRAVLNFPVSGRPVPAEVITAFAMLKAAAAEVNRDLDRLDPDRAGAIVAACGRICEGLTDLGGIARHFPVDIYQTGSGTSTNMNANEVIANLICLARGADIGSSKDTAYLKAGGVHPNDHINAGQSSNDTFPTAMNIAIATALRERLLPAIRRMATELKAKATAWDKIVKIGRTHVQDATPIRLGQEFSGYATQMRNAERRIGQAIDALTPLALGGTAVGTGINTHREFGSRVAKKLADATGISFVEAPNHFEAQHSRDCIVETAGILKTVAISCSKIASDIRLMGCGPRCGIGELKLPAVQPGSSIMPGKVNPVICESMMMVCCQVIGNDTTTTIAGMGGVGGLLDLAVAMPVMAASTLDSANLLANACEMFTDNLLADLQPDEERCASLIEGSLAMCTSLAPVIGYDKSAALAKQAFNEGKTVRDLALEQQILPPDELDRLLQPFSMTEPDE